MTLAEHAAAHIEDALSNALVPRASLHAHLDRQLPGDGPFDVHRVTTGHSNELFAISRSGHEWMLRRPPRVPLAPGAHDVVREARILSAIGSQGVACPRPLVVCADPEVIGAPFFVMDRLDGSTLFATLPSTFDAAEHRRVIGLQLVDALAAIHQVDIDAAGLRDLGRPHGFAARQVARWTRQLDGYRTRPLPDLDDAASWLGENIPADSVTSVVHGDFGLHNVMFCRDAPPRVQAVLDWETATLGDPSCDLGYMLGNWLLGDEQQRWYSAAVPYSTHGFLSRDELVARYEEVTGRAVGDLSWYRALGRLKIAVILEGSYARHRAGDADDPYFAELVHIVPNMAAHALAICRGAA